MMASSKSKLMTWSIASLLVGVGIVVAAVFGKPLWKPAYVSLFGGRTLDEAIELYKPTAEARLIARFDQANNAEYPPASITLLGFKEEKQLQLWAQSPDAGPRLIHTYPILAASGTIGPKLREGDRQVPEGIYQVESLNPNSSYHLSMKLNYPNAFDLKHAAAEGRADNAGSNIFIHGKSASVGCLAMGDPAIEELFLLVHAVGLNNVQVIIAPYDPHVRPLQPSTDSPAWTGQLYGDIAAALEPFAEAE